ncbi:MAG: nucleotidyltransferase domain-containing protein, partial [Candidatus Margulisiibacteriota bacterium]
MDVPYLEEIKAEILRIVRPQRLILFGSYATGMAREESDIDLAMITNDHGKPSAEYYLKIKRAIKSEKYSVDLLVFSSEEY